MLSTADELGPPNRRLIAVLAGDIVGYSRLMGHDEAATIADLKALHSATLPMGAQYGGRIIDFRRRWHPGRVPKRRPGSRV